MDMSQQSIQIEMEEAHAYIAVESDRQKDSALVFRELERLYAPYIPEERTLANAVLAGWLQDEAQSKRTDA